MVHSGIQLYKLKHNADTCQWIAQVPHGQFVKSNIDLMRKSPPAPAAVPPISSCLLVPSAQLAITLARQQLPNKTCLRKARPDLQPRGPSATGNNSDNLLLRAKLLLAKQIFNCPALVQQKRTCQATHVCKQNNLLLQCLRAPTVVVFAFNIKMQMP